MTQCRTRFRSISFVSSFMKIFLMQKLSSVSLGGRGLRLNLMYEISSSFMPRYFNNTPKNRYIYQEEHEVSEIYFILEGTLDRSLESSYKMYQLLKEIYGIVVEKMGKIGRNVMRSQTYLIDEINLMLKNKFELEAKYKKTD